MVPVTYHIGNVLVQVRRGVRAIKHTLGHPPTEILSPKVLIVSNFPT